MPPLILRPSWMLAGWLTLAHGGVMAALWPVDLPLWARLALMFLLLVNGLYLLWREAGRRAADACVGLSCEPDRLRLTLRDGRVLSAQLLGDSVVTPGLTIIRYRAEGARCSRSLVILPDSCDAESFRQLRVWLNWHAQKFG